MPPESDALEPATARAPLTVSALNRAVSGLLERSFPLVRVQGEVGNLTRAASGHWYFNLKDDAAQVRCVMFRGRNLLLGWLPAEGDDVEVTALVSLYEARGEFQLNVESMQRAGQGRLYEQFLRLKQRLADEGLFDASRKRTPPRLPQAIGVVTSPQAAALRDVLTTLRRRAPYVRVIVYPVPVQGAGAGLQIAAMLERAAGRSEAEVLLLVRGGGSIEDLWAFNEEVVARAIRASRVPVIVGVGHESDVTIADFAADLRAATPTAAAELAAPAAEALRETVVVQLRHLSRRLQARLQAAGQRIDYAQRSLAAPRAPLRALVARIDALQTRVAAAAGRLLAHGREQLDRQRVRWQRARPVLATDAVQARRHRLGAAARHAVQGRALRLQSLAARLAALDPAAVLARGYVMALDERGRAVTRAAELRVGAALQLVLAEGGAGVRVESLFEQSPAPPKDES